MDKIRIVISGNVFEGFKFYGPFDSFEDACDFGEGTSEHEWYVAYLEDPIEFFEKSNGGYYWSDAAKKVIERMNVTQRGWK